ncbi:Hypothetical protein NTJ_04324 [Nesidiocoris tenuis]|uniref:Aquaporin n=1 Tax=Nesidiocoris tenuis TaxID=355587 RepID=A0ABN7AKU2_9HEMI|nr:Hypothetical protein NTJ_04324 [Nesidiocoris tenuis]
MNRFRTEFGDHFPSAREPHICLNCVVPFAVLFCRFLAAVASMSINPLRLTPGVINFKSGFPDKGRGTISCLSPDLTPPHLASS